MKGGEIVGFVPSSETAPSWIIQCGGSGGGGGGGPTLGIDGAFGGLGL